MAKEERVGLCFTWKIKNYSCLRHTRGALISPIFTANNFHGSKWYLSFIPSYKNYDEEFISCLLYRNDKDLCNDEISISFNIEVIDGNGGLIVTRSDKSDFKFCRGRGRGWYNFIQRESVTRKCLTWKEDILTIRCRMFTSLKHLESVAVTEIGIEKCAFEWKIKYPDCLASCQTQMFTILKSMQHEISVVVPKDEIKIKIISLDEDSLSPWLLRGKISLLDQENVTVLSQSDEYTFDLSDGNSTWNFTPFIDKKLIEDNKKDYLKDEYLSLLCEFSTANGKESSDILSSTCTSCLSKLDNIMILSDDLSNLHKSGKHSDVQLKCGDMTFPAHKSILSARSPVFSAMFYQEMMEQQSGTVNISDVDTETLKSFLDFMYTGIVDMKDYEIALKLLVVADKYEVLPLKDTCTTILMYEISQENACEILYLADILNINKLKNCALDYVAKHMRGIMIDTHWSIFFEQNPKLSIEIFSHLAHNFEVLPKEN